MSDTRPASIVIDPDLLWDLGYRSLTRAQVTDLLAELYDALELRVGTRIAEGLDSNQLAKFERIVSGRDETQALTWLAQAIPNYKEIVDAEFDYIVGTLRRASKYRPVTAAQQQESESEFLEDRSVRLS